MSVTVLEGIGVTMIAGVMSGNCMLPMKFARRWKWENIWLLYIGFGQVVFPLLLIRFTARNAGGSIKLARLTQRVGDLLQITKLLTVFEVHNSEEEAVQSFRKSAAA